MHLPLPCHHTAVLPAPSVKFPTHLAATPTAPARQLASSPPSLQHAPQACWPPQVGGAGSVLGDHHRPSVDGCGGAAGCPPGAAAPVPHDPWDSSHSKPARFSPATAIYP